MAKQILIDSSFGMVRTAIADNGELVDFYEESPDQGRNKGNIYRGVVKRVDAPIQAAFVKFAGGRDGFLPLRDASAGKPPKPGETVLVQVVKDEVGDKGAALTAKLSLSGRYLVYIPERDGEGGISSKITDEERAALKKVLGDLRIPDGASVILRTAASDKSAEALQEDLDKLIAAHRDIAEKFDAGGEPALLYREAPPVTRYLREYYSEDVARVWVNTHEAYEECSQFFGEYEPDSAYKVELSHDGPMLFQRLGLESEVEKLAQRRVGLKSGANIVIDQAEALVAIDVNSAKASGRGDEAKAPEGKGKRGRGRDRRGGDLEETVFAVNKEAAAEIGKQLRLRDLGGIIIVDFIDMESEKHRRQVEDAMRKALAGDKAKVKVYDISPLGIMQISRQRLRKSGHQFTRPHCEACQGRGWHPSVSAGALSALRKLEERLHGKKAGPAMSVSVPYPVANKLMNEYREHLLALEKRHGCVLRVIATGAVSGEPVIAVLGGGEGANRNGEAPVREAQGRGQQAREGGREGRRKDGRAAEAIRKEAPVADAAQPESHNGEAGQPDDGGVEGDAPNGGEVEGQPRDGRERDGQPRYGGDREGQARNAGGREGQSRHGRGREGQPRIGGEREAQAAEAAAREGLSRNGRGRHGRAWNAGEREAQAMEAAAREGRGPDGRNRDGRPRDGRGRDGRHRDGNGPDTRNGQGQAPRGRDDRGRDNRDRDGLVPKGQPMEGQGGTAEIGAPGMTARPEFTAQVPPAGDHGRDRDRQGGREERGGRRRRGGRGRGRGRDGGQRDGRVDQGAVRDGAGHRPQGEPHAGVRSDAAIPQETATAGERSHAVVPENRQPHEPRRPETRNPADAGAGRGEVVANVPAGRLNVPPAWDFSSKAEGAQGAPAARVADGAVAPRIRAPRAQKEAKPPVMSAVKAPVKKKGPQPVRPGSGRPAPEPKPRSAKAEGARPQGTRTKAAPAAAEAVKPVKGAKAKRPVARAAKEGGLAPRAKGKV